MDGWYQHLNTLSDWKRLSQLTTKEALREDFQVIRWQMYTVSQFISVFFIPVICGPRETKICVKARKDLEFHAAATVKQKQFWALSGQQWINWEKNISLENIWAPKNIYLSRRGREAGGGEGQLAIHLRPGEGNLNSDLVQVSLAIQRLVQGPTGLG